MSDWISVEDRLPEKHDLYDVWIKGDEDYKPRRIANVIYSKHHGGWINDIGVRIDLSVFSITHWMPLPDPPETEAPELFEGTREQLNNLGIRK